MRMWLSKLINVWEGKGGYCLHFNINLEYRFYLQL